MNTNHLNYINFIDLDNLDTNNISIKRLSNNFINITYNNKPLHFWTPKLFMPFGIEEKFNSYFINFELYDFNNDKDMQFFLKKIIEIENKLIELLGIDSNYFNSQIRENPPQNPILYTKIIEKNKKILTTVKNNKNEFLNFFNLEKRKFCKNNILIDKIWVKQNKFYLKYKLTEMIIYD